MPNHIIHKQKVLLQTTKSANAFAMQNRISNLLNNELLGKLETLFNQICPNGKILRIDKLSLNLGTITEKNLEAGFSEKLLEQLSLALSNLKQDDSEIKFIETAQQKSLFEALRLFLVHGYLPWYQTTKNFQEWELVIQQSFSNKEWYQLVEVLKEINKTNNHIINRLAMQFSIPFLQKVLLEIHPALNKNWDQLYKEIQIHLKKTIKNFSVTAKEKSTFLWQQAIKIALVAINETDFKTEILARISNWEINISQERLLKTKEIPEKKEQKKETNDTTKQDKNENKKLSQPTEDEFFTNNCGVVILHPFLLMHFQELGLLAEKAFKNMPMQHRAVLLLHYLATDETETAEFNLLVAKLLCGVDFDEPVPNYIELTDKEKEQSDILLKAVTQHWEPLKRSSAEGLQESFLKREGKLKQTATGWQLQVEQKTIDMLLKKLPWGISVIKLPWMKGILNVEWS